MCKGTLFAIGWTCLLAYICSAHGTVEDHNAEVMKTNSSQCVCYETDFRNWDSLISNPHFSPCPQWARYGALGTGILYGIFHNRTVHKLEERHQHFVEKKAAEKAKKDKEYADLVAAASSARGGVCWFVYVFVCVCAMLAYGCQVTRAVRHYCYIYLCMRICVLYIYIQHQHYL